MTLKKFGSECLSLCALGLFSFSAMAGPCSEFKQSLTAKKGTCKSLPQEQRASCRDEIRAIKEKLKACKMEAKANRKNKKSPPQ
jgi:uncharacterized membrane protein